MMKSVFLGLSFPIAILLLWQAASSAGQLPAAYFPAPSQTWAALMAQLNGGSFLPPLIATVSRMLTGWLLACILGTALGALIGSSMQARIYLGPMLEFIRPFPASAIIPAATLILGLSNQMTLFVIAFGSIWPILLATLHGFAVIEPRLKESARLMEFTPFQFLRKIALPSAAPDIFAGARISLAIALILAVVVEMQASQPGLGQNILLAQRMFRSPDLYAGLIVLAALGGTLSFLLAVGERLLGKWVARTE